MIIRYVLLANPPNTKQIRISAVRIRVDISLSIRVRSALTRSLAHSCVTGSESESDSVALRLREFALLSLYVNDSSHYDRLNCNRRLAFSECVLRRLNVSVPSVVCVGPCARPLLLNPPVSHTHTQTHSHTRAINTIATFEPKPTYNIYVGFVRTQNRHKYMHTTSVSASGLASYQKQSPQPAASNQFCVCSFAFDCVRVCV